MITYSKEAFDTIRVSLDNKYVGFILREVNGWRYYPKGKKTGGDLFSNLNDCKKSLESE